MKSDWFKEWFNTSEYLDVYKHRNEAEAEAHIKFILQNVSLKSEAKVLDMACGAGRHAIILARYNYNVTAVDLSERLLSVAKQAADDEGLRINFIHSDIRDFNPDEKYDLILNLFTSFGYFETDIENFSILQKAYNLLNKNGIFILDYFNKEYLKNNLTAYSNEIIDNERIIQERKIENDRVIKKITIIKDGETNEFFESVKMYSKEKLTEKLKEIGFDIYKTFGDFSGNKFDLVTSPRLILICSK